MTHKLGRWHHGASNEVRRLEGCEGIEDGSLGDGLSDGEAMKRVRRHIAETGHTVEHSRVIYREIKAGK